MKVRSRASVNLALLKEEEEEEEEEEEGEKLTFDHVWFGRKMAVLESMTMILNLDNDDEA